jgi:hypothetical protein
MHAPCCTFCFAIRRVSARRCHTAVCNIDIILWTNSCASSTAVDRPAANEESLVSPRALFLESRRAVHSGPGQLEQYGFVQRAEIGAGAQEITPPLAAGLGLSREWGVLISDVAPAGPAEAAGLKSQDIINAVMAGRF